MRFTKFLSKALIISVTATAFASSCLAADYVEPTTKMEFVFIKGAVFKMGDPYGIDRDALPLHNVSVRDFMIGKYEVTFDQYDRFCDETKHQKPSDEGWGRGNRPAINVSWKDAVAFTEWLSKKSGKNFRLPSEAEWEYAAKANKATRYWWGNEIMTDKANCRGCMSKPLNGTTPVGSFEQNPMGLHDMNGNVYEWVADDWHEDYQGTAADGAPRLEGDKTIKISRGGSWFYDAEETIYYKRCWGEDGKYNYQGFRVVLDNS